MTARKIKLDPAEFTKGLVSVRRTYEFSASHRVPCFGRTHKCARTHGHNYTVTVEVSGRIGSSSYLVSFEEIDRAVAPLVAAFDHRDLNKAFAAMGVPRVAPTTENVARAFLSFLRERLYAYIVRVTVQETRRGSVTVCD